MYRRAFLGLTVTAAVGGCIGNGGSDGETESYDDDWFENVANYDGEVDMTGESTTSVTVGGGSDDLAFVPAAIRVSTGTTVVWEWTGNGGRHNVVDDGGEFESEYYEEGNATFEYTFDSTGVYQYYCDPHRELGMKGGVRVVEKEQ
jgi:halocyanin-like protein